MIKRLYFYSVTVFVFLQQLKNIIYIFSALLFVSCTKSTNTSYYSRDSNDLFVRLVKIEIFPTTLSEYTAILNEQMNTAVLLESGVLEYRVVNEKDNPHLFTLIETYRDYASYLSHIKTSHFLKYKVRSENMVKSLELIDANLIGRTKKD